MERKRSIGRLFEVGLLCLAGWACGGAEHPPADESSTREEAAGDGAIFRDVTSEAGLDFFHFNGMTGQFYLAEVTAGGVALADFDNDDDLDVLFVQGVVLEPGASAEDAEIRPPAGTPLGPRLFLNQLETGELRFEDASAEWGLAPDGHYGMGVATGDFDGDGWVDLYLTNLRQNRLYRNAGDHFEDVTAEWGAEDPSWSVPASFFDYDRDGDLDLFVGNYVEMSIEEPRTCFRVTGARDYCGPLAYTEVSDRLLRNEGDHYLDVTLEAGMKTAFGSALGSVVADFDGDGWADLYVANDGRPNQLWINQEGKGFVDEALLRGAAVNAEGLAEASMGVVAADLDGDADEDLFMAHLLGETNTQYENDGIGNFVDRSIVAGLAAPSKWATAFGAAAFDYDNDGWLDLMTVNGEVRVIEEQAQQGLAMPLRQPNQLFRNLGEGRFEEVSDRAGEGWTRLEVSRGAAVGDLDNDGDLDVAVLNNAGPAQLFLNETGHRLAWIGFRVLDGARDALGAQVRVDRGAGPRLVRTVRTDGSYASASDSRVLFGLGDAKSISRVSVAWGDGEVDEWSALPTGEYHVLRRGEGSTSRADESPS